MLRKVVIIATGGKIGKPFLSCIRDLTERKRQEQPTTHETPTTAQFTKKETATLPRNGRRQFKDELGPAASYGEMLFGPSICDCASGPVFSFSEEDGPGSQ